MGKLVSAVYLRIIRHERIKKLQDENKRLRSKIVLDYRRVNGDDVVFYDGIIHVFTDDKANSLILSPSEPEDFVGVSLNECKSLVDYNGKSVIYVMFNDALHGSLYCFGNHGEFWEKCGVTGGYY